MSELQPQIPPQPNQEPNQINGNGATTVTAATIAGAATISGGTGVNSSDAVGSKRQRRPSVRLGDLGGDQVFDSHSRRAPKPWKSHHSHSQHHNHHHNNNASATTIGLRESSAKASSKTRSLVNFSETLESDERDANLEAMAIGSWRQSKDSSSVRKRGLTATAKRVRSNWVVSHDDDGDNGNDNGDGDGGGENSDSPVNSVDERENLYGRRQSNRRLVHDGVVELLSGPSDTEAREWNGNGGEDGVRVWLNGLGLGRYAPVFEVHEVDDEVLPMLTLEDLKDMGINAVGSRRKMFCAIQKLGKGFS